MKNLTIAILLLIPIASQAQSQSILVSEKQYNLTYGTVVSQVVDTALTRSQIHNPLYRSFFSWNELGNTGMPAISRSYPRIRNAFDSRLFQPYEPYGDSAGQILFYEAKSPFTLLNYNSGGAQDKHGQTITAVYGRNLKDQGNLTFKGMYVNSDGHFSNQKSNASSIQLNYRLQKERYMLVAGLSRQSFNTAENGGLRTEGSLVDSRYPMSLPVNLDQATSVTSLLTLQGRQEGIIAARKDTASSDSSSAARPPMKALKWEHRFAIRDIKRLYTDESPPVGFYPLVTAGLETIKDSVRYSVFTNTFRLLPDTVKIRGNSILFRAGLSPDFYRYQFQDTVFASLRVGVEGELDYRFRSADIRIGGKWILAGFSAGDHELFAKAAWRFGKSQKSNQLEAEWFSRGAGADPFVLNYGSAVYQWNNTFRRQTESGFAARAFWGKPRLAIQATALFENGRIYFDNLGLPKQSLDPAFSVFLETGKQFKAGPFHADLRLLAQYTTSQVIRLPLLAGYLGTYMHHDIHFKSTGGMLELEYGLDFRYDTPFKAYGYMPATGMFYLQDESLTGNYPWLDLFAQIKVKRTRLFVQYCHTFSDILAANSFAVSHYPYLRPHLKYGVYWHFYD